MLNLFYSVYKACSKRMANMAEPANAYLEFAFKLFIYLSLKSSVSWLVWLEGCYVSSVILLMPVF